MDISTSGNDRANVVPVRLPVLSYAVLTIYNLHSINVIKKNRHIFRKNSNNQYNKKTTKCSSFVL